ncbi:MAG: hypothetical protein Q8R89_02660, partial [Desulfomicrobium sp.]|nr:hypothetical protein [Desulfomicrobium sp.]
MIDKTGPKNGSELTNFVSLGLTPQQSARPGHPRKHTDIPPHKKSPHRHTSVIPAKAGIHAFPNQLKKREFRAIARLLGNNSARSHRAVFTSPSQDK